MTLFRLALADELIKPVNGGNTNLVPRPYFILKLREISDKNFALVTLI